MVCLTGLTRNSKDYAHLAARLSARHRVICPDYRGRGRSAHDPDWRNYQPPVYLSDLRHLLTVAGIHRAVFIGTSLGGLIAAAMTLAMPGVCSAGFTTTVLPVTSAAVVMPVQIASGKFHGLITTATPRG